MQLRALRAAARLRGLRLCLLRLLAGDWRCRDDCLLAGTHSLLRHQLLCARWLHRPVAGSRPGTLPSGSDTPGVRACGSAAGAGRAAVTADAAGRPSFDHLCLLFACLWRCVTGRLRKIAPALHDMRRGSDTGRRAGKSPTREARPTIPALFVAFKPFLAARR